MAGWSFGGRGLAGGFIGKSETGRAIVRPLNPLVISGREVLPLVEGGKGISVSNGESSGAWAASAGVGTFSGVNADSYDGGGGLIEQVYRGLCAKCAHARGGRPDKQES